MFICSRCAQEALTPTPACSCDCSTCSRWGRTVPHAHKLSYTYTHTCMYGYGTGVMSQPSVVDVASMFHHDRPYAVQEMSLSGTVKPNLDIPPKCNLNLP